MTATKSWLPYFPWPQPESHKYSRGSVLVAGGDVASTGAARLAANAALRVCGISTIASNIAALPIYAASLLAVMVRPYDDENALYQLFSDKKYHAILLGPAIGVGEASCRKVLAALATGKPAVLDADALTSFAGNEGRLFAAIASTVVMTPHAGEFKKLFGNIEITEAAKVSKSIIVLKGHNTTIAAPDGRIVINEKASPWLATAGSGDVLAGIIAGLLAGGMPAFEAACAGVWIHAKAAEICGVALTSEDLIPAISGAIGKLIK